MNDKYVDHLIQSYLDNCLTPEEQARFSEIMLESEAARLRFWAIAEIHGLASQATDSLVHSGLNAFCNQDELVTLRDKSKPVESSATYYLGRQSSFALLSGLVLGVLISVFTWPVRGMPQKPVVTNIAMESFESTSSPPEVVGLTNRSDVWGGDFSEITAAQQEVEPADGKQMLQILRADYFGKPEPDASYCGDLYRLVDLRSMRHKFTKDGTFIHASALFNMSPQPSREEFRHSIRLMALTSDVISNPVQFDALMVEEYASAMARQNLKLDNDPQTWELGDCELRLPADTDFVLIHIGITYGHSEDSIRRITFPGQFVDDIQITLSSNPE
ncbi:hypothetical protein [Bremerella alba]|uniref:Zinc-finger domain-containing protein n=1 Tax=Bremerella alba TaxID=980252 RepID=A0A7V9A6C0_9BACT|nr:hypothetical protein [Bremerella alba]MBA2114157.1 hypothetical protein [Bremerella alba]